MGGGSKEVHCSLRYAVTSIHPRPYGGSGGEENKGNINMWWEPQPEPCWKAKRLSWASKIASFVASQADCQLTCRLTMARLQHNRGMK